MKNSRAFVVAMVAIAFVLAIGALAGRAANASGPSPVNLRTAANFSVLAGGAVTNTLATTTDRDVGVSPGTSVSGFTGPPDGTAGGGGIHSADSAANQAQIDLTAAYTAANLPATASHTALGGLTLPGGVYDSGGATLNLTGVLTLDGQNDPSSVWIFKASSDLVTATSSYVSYINGASPCNVFWRVMSSATLGTGSTFVGTIMAQESVTVGSSVTVYGRALAQSSLGNVTLINDRFLTTACASAPLLIPPTRPPFTIAPGSTPTPVPSPMTTFTPAPAATPATAPTATPASAATPVPTAAPVAAAAPTATPKPAAVAGAQNLPSTSTGDPADPLTILGVALTGFGILLLRRPTRHL